MSHVSRRLGALVAVSALSVTGITLVAAPAQAAGTDPRPIASGADWLAGELVGGLLPASGGGSLFGPSIDAALSLKAAGGHDADVTAIGTALGAQITSYVDFAYSYDSDFPADGDDEDFAGEATGATAKALVLAQALPTPTTTLGGINLLSRLEGYVAPSGNSAGRLIGVATKDGVDDPSSEYTNVLGQSLGVMALNKAGSDKTAAAAAFLLKQQCAAGFFRLELAFDKTAADQSCGAGDDPDTDATSIAVRALAQIANPSAEVVAALDDAEAWLLETQQTDGSFGGGGPTATPNANSTAGAGLALAATGEAAAATKAATWVRAHQVDEIGGGCATSALQAERGAIAYGDEALANGKADGITPGARQEWRIAAAQGVAVLALAPASASPFGVAGPGGYQRAGSTVAYKVSGIDPGSTTCLTAFGTSRILTGDANGRVTVTLTLPAGTANRTVTLRGPGGTSASTLTKALAAKTLNVTAPARAAKGSKATIRVKGLKPGEKVTLTYKGKVVRSGYASPAGTFAAKVSVGRSLGKKVVRAYGRFPVIRKGATTLKVVR